MKPANPIDIHLDGQLANRWHIRVNPSVNSIADVFHPQFWVSCTKLRNADIVRVEATDGSYDFALKVLTRTIGGKLVVGVEVWPKMPVDVIDALDAAAEQRPTLRNGKPVPRVEFAGRDSLHKWRVIGFDGELASAGYGSEEEANHALAKYVAAFGITKMSPPPAPAETVSKPLTIGPAPDLNISAQKRKEAEKKAKQEEQRKSDMAALAIRKAAAQPDTAA